MIDILLLTLIALASVSIAARLERDKIWLMLPTGFVVVAVIRVLSVVVSAPIVRLIPDVKGLDYWVFVGALVAVSIPGLAWVRTHIRSLIAALIAVYLAQFATRVMGMGGLHHGDSIWILTLAEYIGHGGDPTYLGTQLSLKRGFSLLLLLGLSKSSDRLDAILPLTYLLLVLVTFGLAWHLLGKYSRRVKLIAIGATAIVVGSTWMAFVSVFYINGHTLVALGLMVSISSMLLTKDSFVNPNSRLIAFCSGLALVTFTRPEGILLSLVVIALFAGYSSLRIRQILISVAVVFAAFMAWMLTVDSYIVGWSRAPFVIAAMLIALGVLALGLMKAPKFVHRVFWLTPWILLGIFTLVQVFFAADLVRGEVALLGNLLWGYGRWGVMVWGLLFVIAASMFLRREPIYNLMLRILGSMAVASLLSKMLDGGVSGEPTLGRLGWVDSLNRMWIHLLGIFVVVAVLGIAQLLTSKFVGWHVKSSNQEDSHNAAIE